MKFTCSVDINAPREKVVELYDNVDNLVFWTPGLKSVELLSGAVGQPGAKSKITLINGGKPMELIETIVANTLPEQRSVLVEHKHMDNTMNNRFTALDANTTRYEADIDYIKTKGFVPKMMLFLMPGMFRKQPQKWLENFKVFVETKAN